jgi:Tol biopolymer transport system component
MIEITHQHARRLARAELHAKLPDSQWAALRVHLETCGPCAAYREALGNAEKDLGKAVRLGGETIPGPGPDLAGLVSAARVVRARTRARALRGAGVLAVLTLFLLLGGPRWLGGLFATNDPAGAAEAPPQAGASIASLRDTPTPAPPTPTPAATFEPGVFPGVVAYEAFRGGDPAADREIYLINPGAEPVNLTDHPAEDSAPAWSPDGEWIAFLSTRADPENGRAQVFVTNLAGTRLVQLTAEAGITWEGPISWSRDGRQLAMVGRRDALGGQRWLYLVPLDGSGPLALAGTRGAVSPKFARASDGLAFAFRDGEEAGVGLYRMEDGPDVAARWAETRPAPQPLAGAGFDWSRDGSALVYIAGREDEAGTGGAAVIAVRDVSEPERWAAGAMGQGGQNSLRVAEADAAGAFRGVAFSPSGAVITLEDGPSGCVSLHARAARWGRVSFGPFPMSSLCIESPIDSASWSPDGRWMTALGRLPGQAAGGLYALRVPVRSRGAEVDPPAVDAPVGTILRLADAPLEGAQPRIRPRLRAFESALQIDPQPAAQPIPVTANGGAGGPASGEAPASLSDLPPSDLTARTGGPRGRLVYVVQSGAQSLVLTTNPDGTGGQVLFASAGASRCPAWSPDGRSVALVAQPAAAVGAGELLPGAAALVAAVQEEIAVLESPGQGRGSKSARFVSDITQLPEVAAPQTAAPELAEAQAVYGCPVWSPVGGPGGPVLAATVQADGAHYLALLPALDGQGEPRYIRIGRPAPGAAPVWSADGRSLYLAQYPSWSRSAPRVLTVRLPEEAGGQIRISTLPATVDWMEILGLAALPDRPYLAAMTITAAEGRDALVGLRLMGIPQAWYPQGWQGEERPPLLYERPPLTVGRMAYGGELRTSAMAYLPTGDFGMALHSGPSERYKAELGLFDLDRRRWVSLAPVEDRLLDVTWSPDGRWVIYSTESGLWGLDVRAARQGRAGPVWLSPVPVVGVDWKEE